MSTPERLAYWYFRLNGFLTTENFVVHPDSGTDQRTDADLLAVRFQHRSELLENPMADDPAVADCATLANVIIAEVKTGRCVLNGPWTNPAAQNLRRVVKSVGCVADAGLDAACAALHGTGRWHDDVVTIRLFAIGEATDTSLPIAADQQLTWHHVIQFCIDRFTSYDRVKRAVGQWAEDGRQLHTTAIGRNAHGAIRVLFGLRPMEAA